MGILIWHILTKKDQSNFCLVEGLLVNIHLEGMVLDVIVQMCALLHLQSQLAQDHHASFSISYSTLVRHKRKVVAEQHIDSVKIHCHESKPSSGSRGPDPLPLLKQVKKRWAPLGAACFASHRLPRPPGQISGSAAETCKVWKLMHDLENQSDYFLTYVSAYEKNDTKLLFKSNS